jgi:hypothetical protein
MKGENGNRKPFPMHAKDDLTSQIISIRKQFPTYKDYGMASMDDLWPRKNRENAIKKTATNLQTSFIENKGKGKFSLKPLPLEAQTAPVFGMISEDLDGDGNLDLLMVGNDYGMEPYSGRHDAFNGLVLKGDGNKNFKALTIEESGFFVKGDAKGLARIHTAKNEDIWIATQNSDSLIVLHKNKSKAENTKWLTLKPDDFCADITLKNGIKRKVEFYYGSTFLSQSSRKFLIDKDAVKLTITNFKGQKRQAL